MSRCLNSASSILAVLDYPFHDFNHHKRFATSFVKINQNMITTLTRLGPQSRRPKPKHFKKPSGRPIKRMKAVVNLKSQGIMDDLYKLELVYDSGGPIYARQAIAEL